MTDLDKLIEAVEAGSSSRAFVEDMACNIFGLRNGVEASSAYAGHPSPDVRLLVALLPGWAWWCEAGGTDRQCFGVYDPKVGGPPVTAPTFLLAILKAVRSQQ